MAACKSDIHDLFMQGKSYKEIAALIGANASSVALRVTRYRKQEPEKWPRFKKYVQPLSLKMEVYNCVACEFIFAVEHTDDLHDVTCPYCWDSEKIQEKGISYLKLKEHHM